METRDGLDESNHRGEYETRPGSRRLIPTRNEAVPSNLAFACADKELGTSHSLPEPYYEQGGITIYHGDCREILRLLGEFDLCLTDPPYGIGAGREKPHNGWKDYGIAEWDLERPAREVFTAIRDKSLQQVIWGGNYFTDYLPPTMQWLVWDKGQRDFSLADCEMAWSSLPRAARIFDHSRGAALQDGKQHPTQKPVALMRWCIEFFPDARSILDPFMGSGTTLRAAKDLGRKAIGIEIEERYCEIAANRLRQEVLL